MTDATTTPNMPIARLIDVSAVQAWHGRGDIEALAAAARDHGFVSAHALPAWAPLLRERLADGPTLAGAPVGFPSGGAVPAIKVAEAAALCDVGLDELDILVNVGKLAAGELGDVREELRAIVDVVAGRASIKVILEVTYLDDDAIRAGCDAAIEAGAAFVKTGTGWSRQPTTEAHIRLIHDHVGEAIGIKASGGIRSLATLRRMQALGATRFGVNLEAAIRILDEARAEPLRDRVGTSSRVAR